MPTSSSALERGHQPGRVRRVSRVGQRQLQRDRREHRHLRRPERLGDAGRRIGPAGPGRLRGSASATDRERMGAVASGRAARRRSRRRSRLARASVKADGHREPRPPAVHRRRRAGRARPQAAARPGARARQRDARVPRGDERRRAPVQRRDPPARARAAHGTRVAARRTACRLHCRRERSRRRRRLPPGREPGHARRA